MKSILFFFIILFSALSAADTPHYVGDHACKTCHSKAFEGWHGSQHAMAMQVADAKSVKADFNNTQFNYNGIVSTFYKKDGKFMVRTDGPDGKLHDYEIAYTFGIYPLQQYMIKFPGGRVQVLDPTWDNRPKEEGGQRWYHIHKDDNVTAGDPLHWTGPNMNWNYMCADCHSTNLKKNYDAKTKTYHTTWSSINVSCEACHGPASTHAAWAKHQDFNLTNKGFPVSLKYKKGKWDVNASYHRATLNNHEIEVCAKCHARRSQLDDDFTRGDAFTDHYLPVRLEKGLYFPDGKIEDEVYVYNSFLQSKMYAKGVTCSDCHNPHSLQRRASGDKVCFQCHKEEKYSATSHHHHPKGSSGASCVGCHMPARTYMGIDSRKDHSFRIPRPDISVAMPEVPNACNLCHKDKKAKWAADTLKAWFGHTPVGKQNFAHALHALREQSYDALKGLYQVLTSDQPDIAKDTVSAYLGEYPSRQTFVTTLQMLRHKDPKRRRAALIALERFPLKIRFKETFKMLEDPSKIVRIEAARQLSVLPLGSLEEQQRTLIEKVFKEYESTLQFSAERPESQLSLGIYYSNRKMYDKAEAAYKEALRLQPKFVPAYINYSQFLSAQGREEEARTLLQKGPATAPPHCRLTPCTWTVVCAPSSKRQGTCRT